MNMTRPTTIAPSAINAHPHHCNPPLPDVCVPDVVAGATCTVAVRLVTDVVLVWVTVFVFGGVVTVAVVVLVSVDVDVDVDGVVVVVVVVSLVATGSAVPVPDAVVRLLLTCEATLDAADLAC
jgi:hypothetical protein